ncbi:SDR family oxidoreductase [Nocardioides sp. cx-169]|uniref:SDR family NAD(P)-dependent oxidoreductase n=1 Tax=Nocardioides sp. cx-169 TaxID=2899080 RepID=UPI001E5E6FFA|nr:SDR family NAD(P)-dependent oxidoreductase [Nocardioides sp. cx-169]MCD4533661.1 SDR family oxidoreductase [Nocardioides sp. cx-169]
MESWADVSGRRVVLTGAGRGLGRILASAFDAAGAHLGLVARTKDSLDDLAQTLKGDPLVCAGDVRDDEFNGRVARQMVERFGGVDVWICNAGISPEMTSVSDMSPETWREIVDINLTGTFLGAQAAARVMEPGGRIIITGSVIGDRPRAGLSAYAASKSGAHALTQALALELGPRDITVNAVALGWFDTGLGAHWHRDERRENDIVDHTSLGRWGTAGDLPGAYLFLASAASGYVTGTTLTVDGGYSLI